MKKYIVFHIEGGIGKNIMATAVVKAIKKQHPDREIIIVSPHSGLWLNNPDIYRIYLMGQTPYFYEDFIKDKDIIPNPDYTKIMTNYDEICEWFTTYST